MKCVRICMTGTPSSQLLSNKSYSLTEPRTTERQPHFRSFRRGKRTNALRSSELYSAASTRVLSAKYADALRTTPRSPGHGRTPPSVPLPTTRFLHSPVPTAPVPSVLLLRSRGFAIRECKIQVFLIRKKLIQPPDETRSGIQKRKI